MRKVLLSRISFSALMLTFLTLFLFFSFSSSLEISQWDKEKPSGNITNEYINNTYINQTLELNETQFETGEPATIKTSWLTSFIESISKWANYYTKSEIDNRYSNNTGDQDLSTYVEGNMSAETYNETTITPTTNYSLSFDGVNDYIFTDYRPYLNSFAISTWVKPNQLKNQVVWDNGWWQGTKNAFLFLTASGIIYAGVRNRGMVTQIGTQTNFYRVDEWYHLVVVANGTHLVLYVNSNLEKIGEANINAESTNLLYWGAPVVSSGGYLNGQIDEVLIFNRSLSSSEVADLYNNGNGLYAETSIAPFNNGLVTGYHFDEGSGTTAYDITGRNNGTLVNGPTWVDGKISHNLTSTTEILGTIGLMPWVSATNFISTDFSLQWIGNTLKNPWFTSTELGNSTNRFNGWFWNTNSVNLNVTNQTTMNNLTVNNLNVTNGWSGNCVNSSILNGIIVGCND